MLQKHIDNGFFITFEGPEGAGKSTQIKRLCTTLGKLGHDVITTREPGGTPLGETLRGLIKHYHGPDAVTAEAELLMFGASRAQLMRHTVEPHLAAGGIVLCDRFADSTTVYQGMARGLDIQFIERLHDFTLRGRWPDLTLLLDLDVDLGFERSRSRNGHANPGDRIEAEPRAFHQQVRNGFLELARSHPGRFRVINAAAEPDCIEARIWEIVQRAFS